MKIERKSQAPLPTHYGAFISYAYYCEGLEHLALVKGQVEGKKGVLTRLHSECLTGDLFGSKRCDCGEQLKMSLERLGIEESGVLIYLRGHEGRGIGLGKKLEAYCLQDKGLDTVEANVALGLPVDARKYDVGALILKDLGVFSVRLLTNNPAKAKGLCGIEVCEEIPLVVQRTKENGRYLDAKKEKLGHQFILCA